jgi:hypothetical protein
MTKTPKRSSDLANGETSEGGPTQPTSGEGVAKELSRRLGLAVFSASQ